MTRQDRDKYEARGKVSSQRPSSTATDMTPRHLSGPVVRQKILRLQSVEKVVEWAYPNQLFNAPSAILADYIESGFRSQERLPVNLTGVLSPNEAVEWPKRLASFNRFDEFDTQFFEFIASRRSKIASALAGWSLPHLALLSKHGVATQLLAIESAALRISALIYTFKNLYLLDDEWTFDRAKRFDNYIINKFIDLSSNVVEEIQKTGPFFQEIYWELYDIISAAIDSIDSGSDDYLVDTKYFLHPIHRKNYNSSVEIKYKVQSFLNVSFDSVADHAESLADAVTNLIETYNVGSPLTTAPGYELIDQLRGIPPFQAHEIFVDWLRNNNPIPKYGSSSQKFTPTQYYDDYWRKFERAGLLYRDTLHNYDDKITPAIRSYCQRNPSLNPNDYLPPAAHERSLKIVKTAPTDSPEFLDAIVQLAHREKSRRSKNTSAPII